MFSNADIYLTLFIYIFFDAIFVNIFYKDLVPLYSQKEIKICIFISLLGSFPQIA